MNRQSTLAGVQPLIQDLCKVAASLPDHLKRLTLILVHRLLAYLAALIGQLPDHDRLVLHPAVRERLENRVKVQLIVVGDFLDHD